MGELIQLPRRKCRACGRRMIPVFTDQETHPTGCGDEAYWDRRFDDYQQALHDRFEHRHPEWKGSVERQPWPQSLASRQEGATAGTSPIAFSASTIGNDHELRPGSVKAPFASCGAKAAASTDVPPWGTRPRLRSRSIPFEINETTERGARGPHPEHET